MNRTALAVFSALLLFTFSCGVEDYLYLIPVDESRVRLDAFNTTATVSLPNFSTTEYNYFTNFSLFYRIYISDANIIATYPYSSSDLYTINSSLSSDFSALAYYTSTSNTTSVATNLGSQFSSRRYYALEIDDNLDDYFLGRQIMLDFSPGRAPVLIVNPSSPSEQTYTLRRTGGEGNFRPVPSDRLFFNSQDLNSSANATALINNDVQDKTSAVAPRRTYASIYIVTTGRDYNLTPLYSRPTHVGIFLLPDTAAGSQ
jgi:hypothetical protein